MLKINFYSVKGLFESTIIDLQPETNANFECLVGRANNCSLVLDNPQISRYHGKFTFTEQGYHFIDLDSKIGTKISNKSLPPDQPKLLKVGDILQIGDIALEIIAITKDIKNINELTTIGDSPSSRYNPEILLHNPAEIKRWHDGELTLHCVRVTNEAPDVKTFSFTSNPPVLFTYKPGQFVTLDLEIAGEKVQRSYSISSTPSRPHILEITVKRVHPPESNVPKGLVSNWLHDNIKEGSEVSLDGPMGNFTCFARSCQKLLLISAGSGITPMMSMSRWIYDTAANCDVVFLHSAPNAHSIIFRQELELMAARQQNFHLALTITKPELGGVWSGLRGRVTPQMIEVICHDFGDRHVYVCGPNPFMRHTKEMLKKMNFPMENYFEESFGGDKNYKKSAPTDTSQFIPALPKSFGIEAFLEKFTIGTQFAKTTQHSTTQTVKTPKLTQPSKSSVVFSKSGKEVSCDGDLSILEMGEQAGIKMRSGCRSGICGACKKMKSEGTVKMEGFDAEALTSAEQKAGYILTCISFPVGTVVIDA